MVVKCHYEPEACPKCHPEKPQATKDIGVGWIFLPLVKGDKGANEGFYTSKSPAAPLPKGAVKPPIPDTLHFVQGDKGDEFVFRQPQANLAVSYF